MSTGLECEFFEPKRGDWYYALQDWSCPVGAWDWREYATCYGPFSTYEAACEHLRVNHANPGGHTVTDYNDFTNDGHADAYTQLIAETYKPGDARRFR